MNLLSGLLSLVLLFFIAHFNLGSTDRCAKHRTLNNCRKYEATGNMCCDRPSKDDEIIMTCCPHTDWIKIPNPKEETEFMFDMNLYLPYLQIWYVKVLAIAVLVLSVAWLCCLCDCIQNCVAQRNKRCESSKLESEPTGANNVEHTGISVPENITVDEKSISGITTSTRASCSNDINTATINSVLTSIEEEGSCYNTPSGPASLRLAYYSHPLNFNTSTHVQLKTNNGVSTFSKSKVTNEEFYMQV